MKPPYSYLSMGGFLGLWIICVVNGELVKIWQGLYFEAKCFKELHCSRHSSYEMKSPVLSLPGGAGVDKGKWLLMERALI